MNYTLNSQSWHFWLANQGNRRVWTNDEIDFCTYTKCVLAGFFGLLSAITIISIPGVILLWGLGQDLYFLWVWITTGVRDKDLIGIPGVVTLGVISLISAVALGMSVAKIYDTLILNPIHKVAQSPGFVGLSYRKFKDRTCFIIKFK